MRQPALLVLVVTIILGCESKPPPEFMDGDLIFQESMSRQSMILRKATRSNLTHMGMVFLTGNGPHVFEAVGPVRSTPVHAWIERGRGKGYVVRRLKNAEDLLTPHNVARLTREARKYLEKPYDLHFRWSDERMYCSELVWKAYSRALGVKIGVLQRLGDFDLSDPLVIGELEKRYGERIPLNETVISPAQMYQFDGLITIHKKMRVKLPPPADVSASKEGAG
jgi:hypothetical protein